MDFFRTIFKLPIITLYLKELTLNFVSLNVTEKYNIVRVYIK